MSLFIGSVIQLCLLFLKSLILIDGVIQLGKCIGNFPAVYIRLKSSGDPRVNRVPLGQRRNLYRMTGDKDGTVQITRHILTVVFEHFCQDLASRLIFHILFIHALGDRCRSRFFVGHDGCEINSGYLLDGVCHVQSFPRRSQVEGFTLIFDDHASGSG